MTEHLHIVFHMKNKSVLNTSNLGFVFKSDDTLCNNFEVLTIDESTFDETWKQVWGEKEYIRNQLQPIIGNASRKIRNQTKN